MVGLTKKVAQLKAELKKAELKKLVDELAEKMAKLRLGEEQAKEKEKSAEELADQKNALKKLAEEEKAEQQCQMEQLEKRMEELKKEIKKKQKQIEKKEEDKAKREQEERKAAAEYASLIGVPVVTNLKAHYKKKKLLHLLEYGHHIPSIYIQKDQQLNDPGLLQSIVNKLATAEQPEEMVGEVKIEQYGGILFTWPQREEHLTLKGKQPDVALTFNEASTKEPTYSGCCLAEYELSNRGCHFNVLIHYFNESEFNKDVWKFIYRRRLA